MGNFADLENCKSRFMNLKPSTEAMQAAIQTARLNHTPFGAALAMGDQVFATAAGAAGQEYDPTTHAEFVVIQKLSEQIRKKDLSGYVLYSTCEPCLHCMREISAHGIQTVVYGCRRTVAETYFDPVQAGNDGIYSESLNDMEQIADFLKKECESLLRKFS